MPINQLNVLQQTNLNLSNSVRLINVIRFNCIKGIFLHKGNT